MIKSETGVLYARILHVQIMVEGKSETFKSSMTREELFLVKGRKNVSLFQSFEQTLQVTHCHAFQPTIIP